MNPYVNIAMNAAKLAGEIILRNRVHMENFHVIEKGQNDFATQIDKDAEKIIIDTIKKVHPHHNILAEESGYIAGKNSDTTWIIDPLDGTTNYIHGFPQFCVSIGVVSQGIIQHGVVYDPIRDELFRASRDKGAKMNGKRLKVSNTAKLKNSLLGTGFPFKDFTYLNKYLTFLNEIIPNCGGIRRTGAAALDLAYVASGRLDGFWEFGLKPWDIAAGALLIQEAGGFITTIHGDHDILNGPSLLAGQPKIYKEMYDLCKRFF